MAVDPTIQSEYFGDTITLSTLNAPVQLLPLLQAIDRHISPSVKVARLFGGSANTAVVLVGSERVSASNFAYELAKSTFVDYWAQGPYQGIPVGRIWLYTTAAATIGVELIA